MPKQDTNISGLRRKYGAVSIDNALRLNPHDFDQLLGWRDELDPQYTKLWLDFTYGGLTARGILSERVRLLVLIAQCVAMGEMEALDSAIRSALGQGVNAREILEVIIQCTVYVGAPKVNRAGKLFHDIANELGLIDELKRTQPPIEGRNAERSLEAERKTWGTAGDRMRRREEMLKKYGWHGISAGLRLQPTHHPEAINRMDAWDQNFLKRWLDFIYGGMYVRGVLDDKTRLLCVVGVCVALDELVQGENHIRASLALGATPREVFEVCVQSTQHWGMPRCLRGMAMLDRVLKEQGRLAELTDTQPPMPE